MKYRILFFMLIFVVSGCNTNVDHLELERDVYAALLSYTGGDKADVLVIREDSTTNKDNLGVVKSIKKLSEGAYKDFVFMNKISSQLPIDVSWNSKVRLLSKEELNNIFRKSSLSLGWKSFYKKYPGSKGIIGFSRVGFNDVHNKAFLYVEIGCGALCGNGYYAWLSKGMFGWKVDRLEHLWVS